MSRIKVGVLVGSLRKDSFCRKLSKALKEVAPQSLELENVAIGELALYNEDLDEPGNLPEAWTVFREKMKSCDAFLFVSPEYNRSVPGVLKNALDVGSRPPSKSVWGGKPGAVLTASPGSIGGFGANHHLRQTLSCLNVPTMQAPEAYLGNIATVFDENGNLTNERTRGFLKKFMESYVIWVDKNKLT